MHVLVGARGLAFRLFQELTEVEDQYSERIVVLYTIYNSLDRFLSVAYEKVSLEKELTTKKR